MATNRLSPPSKSEDADSEHTTEPTNMIYQELSGKQGPTDSHAISQIDPDEEGLVQKAGKTKAVSDIGWGQSPAAIEQRIVPGLSNEDLWLLIRRFDKQLYYVKAVSYTPLQRLDLNRAEHEDFSPDKLRATLERFYTTVALGLISAAKHVARLRSWREYQRTSIFCTVYFTAWLLDMLLPTFFAVLIILVLHPPSRTLLFPPAPIALVDTATGGAKKPQAGYLGSHDSVTGAGEKFKGEAAEKEASNLVASVASLAVGTVAGKHDQEPGTIEDETQNVSDEEMEKPVPDPTEVVSNTADARSAADGDVPADTHDKTRQPINHTVLNAANQSMRVLSDITNTYERFGNALSPTPPFSLFTPHLRMAGALASGLIVSLLVSSYVFVKTSTFVFGFMFFGGPVLKEIMRYLDRRHAHWKKLLELQNSILRGIPTNAQLTLTLLRIGETNFAPLPPPPDSQSEAPTPSSSRNPPIHHDGASPEEIHQSVSPGPRDHSTITPEPKKTGFIPHIVSLFRGTTATGIVSKFAVDRFRAAAGSNHAKTRVGVLRSKDKTALPSGPVDFDARYKGKHGAAVIDSSKDPPLLYFTTEPVAEADDMTVESHKKETVLFKLPVSDVQEMRKTGGLGWKGKLVVGWAVGGKEVMDGLLIVGKEPGQWYQLTAMSLRNQLFDRLIAIDGQVWTSC